MSYEEELVWHQKKVDGLKRLAAFEKKRQKLDVEESNLSERLAEILAERSELDEDEAGLKRNMDKDDQMSKV